MKDRKVNPKELFILSDEDLRDNNRLAILKATKPGDLITAGSLGEYLQIPYTSMYANLQDLARDGYLEFLGLRRVPTHKGGPRVKTNVYRRLDKG